MKNATVTALQHVDVYGKTLTYVKIENENGVHLINVGTKTFEAVGKLVAEPAKQEPEKVGNSKAKA